MQLIKEALVSCATRFRAMGEEEMAEMAERALLVEDVENVFERTTAVKVEPGDIIVVRAPFPLNPEQRTLAAELLKSTFPEQRGLILDAGWDLSVLRQQIVVTR